MWLALWRLSPICCFSLYWLGWISLWKPCHGAIWRLTLKNLFFPANKTPTTTPHPFDAATIKVTASFIGEKITQDGWHVSWQPCFTCPLKHAAGGVICQGASMLPTSYWHGCRLQLLFQTVLPTYKLQLVFLSVSCRLLSRNSVQTSKDMSLEPVEFFRHICFLSAWKNLTFYQYRQWNSVKLCIRLVGCHPSDSHLAIQPVDYVSDWYVASLVAP